MVQGEQKVQGLQGNAGGDSPEAPAGGQAQAQGKGGGGGVVGGVDETSLFDYAPRGPLPPPPYETGKKGGEVGGDNNKGGCAMQ